MTLQRVQYLFLAFQISHALFLSLRHDNFFSRAQKEEWQLDNLNTTPTWMSSVSSVDLHIKAGMEFWGSDKK